MRWDRYFPALDGIRGLAASLVLLHHLFYGTMYGYLSDNPLGDWRGGIWLLGEITRFGWAGVDLFFVLSGFLITGILLDTIGEPGALKNFYRRRLARILPLYYVMVAVVALGTGAPSLFLVTSGLFVTNFFSLFANGTSYGVLWSLSVEMQFYLAWPFVVRRASRRRVALVAMAIILACPMIRQYILTHSPRSPYAWVRMDGMAWGALLALMIRNEGARRWLPRASILALGAGALLFAYFYPPRPQFSPGELFCMDAVALQLVSFGLVAFGLTAAGERSFFSLALPRFFGRISYGVYLIHPPLMMLWDHLVGASGGSFSLVCARAAAVTAGTTGLAYLSFRYFERPFARMTRMRNQK